MCGVRERNGGSIPRRIPSRELLRIPTSCTLPSSTCTEDAESSLSTRRLLRMAERQPWSNPQLMATLVSWCGMSSSMLSSTMALSRLMESLSLPCSTYAATLASRSRRSVEQAPLLFSYLSIYLAISFSTLSLNQIYKTMWKQHGSNQTCSMALVDGLGIAGRIEEPEGFVMPCTDIRCWPTFMPT